MYISNNNKNNIYMWHFIIRSSSEILSKDIDKNVQYFKDQNEQWMQ